MSSVFDNAANLPNKENTQPHYLFISHSASLHNLTPSANPYCKYPTIFCLFQQTHQTHQSHQSHKTKPPLPLSQPQAERPHLSGQHAHLSAVHSCSLRRIPARRRRAFLRYPRDFHLLHLLHLQSPRVPHFHGFPRDDAADRECARSLGFPRGSSGIAYRIENIAKPQKNHWIARKRFRYADYSDNRGDSGGFVELRIKFEGSIQRLQTRQNHGGFHCGFHDSTFGGRAKRDSLTECFRLSRLFAISK